MAGDRPGKRGAVPCIERSIDIDRSVADVWRVLEDISRLPELSPSTIRVDGPERLDTAGQRFTQVVVLAGREFTSDWEVAGVVAQRCLAVEGSVLPGTRYRMVEELVPIGTDRCTVRLRMHYKLPFGLLGRLAGRLGAESRAVEEAEGVLQGLKRLVEQEVPAPA